MFALSEVYGIYDHYHVPRHIPANMRQSTNVDLMLVHRLRRWSNIKSTLIYYHFLSFFAQSCDAEAHAYHSICGGA